MKKKKSRGSARRLTRERRKLRRRIGSMPVPKIIGVRIEREWVTLYYRKENLRAPRALYKASPELEAAVKSGGFIHAGDGIFVNRRATLQDVVKIGRPELTLTAG